MSKQMTSREIEHDLGQLIQASERQGQHIFQLIQRVNALEGRAKDKPPDSMTVFGMIVTVLIGFTVGSIAFVLLGWISG